MTSSNHENAAGPLMRLWGKIVGFALKLKKLGKDDPRRIIHSFKMGLALTLVSIFYYFKPLYEGFGLAAMWAILTVVVVFEFTVGKQLLKAHIIVVQDFQDILSTENQRV